MALEHHKWDAQVGDVAVLAPFPLVLAPGTWVRLASTAEALAREVLSAEGELAARPELHAALGLSRPLARALRPVPQAPPNVTGPRILRFDFHPTRDGWRVSEVNSDVPGGFTESSCFASLVAAHAGAGEIPGDAAAAWLDALAARVPASGAVALLSAPGWLEDVQVVAHLAARLRARGLAAHLGSPHRLRWRDGEASLDTGGTLTPLDAIVRFYQAEWMATLRCRDAWLPLLAGARTPVTNPGSAALTESKRLGAIWAELDAPSAAWGATVPETRDPRAAPALLRGDWVLKPAFGNTGDDVALRDTMSRSAWAMRVAEALATPRRWAAQRRFESVPVDSPLGPMHACVGVYVVDGRATGVYGRLSPSRVIDFASMDVAVLVERVER